MHVAHRSYLTAGIAALGAGAIALTPVQPVPTHLAAAQERTVSTLSVNLASSIDVITPWVDTFKLAAQNIKALTDFYLQQPLPLLKTWAANQVTYLQELTSGNAKLIPGQIKNNINTFFYAPWSAGATNGQGNYTGEYISNVPITNPVAILFPNGASQRNAFGLLPAILGDSYAGLKPLIDFTATHYSGEFFGLLATVLSPLVQLTRSFTAVGDYFKAGDAIGAINALLNIPAYTTNAFLNGAGYLDLTNVVNKISPLPPEVNTIGLNLGGLVSPPVPFTGTLAAPTSLSGGVGFDSLATNVTYKIPPFGPTVRISDPGIPVGWNSSVIGLGQFLGKQLLVPKPPAAQAKAPAAAAAPVKAAASAPVVAGQGNASAGGITGGSGAHHAGARGSHAG